MRRREIYIIEEITKAQIANARGVVRNAPAPPVCPPWPWFSATALELELELELGLGSMLPSTAAVCEGPAEDPLVPDAAVDVGEEALPVLELELCSSSSSVGGMPSPTLLPSKSNTE